MGNDLMYEISVIVPVYNAEDTLEIAIESVINQTFDFEKIELILVNDKSTDSSKEIIDKYVNRFDNIKAIHLKENSGLPSKPRNIAIEVCSGKYIMFLDNDDEIAPTGCEVLYSTINETDSDIVSGQVYNKFIDGVYTWLDKTSKKQVVIDNPSVLRSNVWGNIFKTSFIKEKDIKFPLFVPEDGIYAMEAYGEAEKIVWLPEYAGYIFTVEMADKKSYTHDIKQQKMIDYINGHYVYLDLVRKYGFDEERLLNASVSFLLLMFFKVGGKKSEKMHILQLLHDFEKTLNFTPKLGSKPVDIVNNYVLNEEYGKALMLCNMAKKLYNSRKVKNIIYKRYSNLKKVDEF